MDLLLCSSKHLSALCPQHDDDVQHFVSADHSHGNTLLCQPALCRPPQPHVRLQAIKDQPKGSRNSHRICRFQVKMTCHDSIHWLGKTIQWFLPLTRDDS